MSGYGHTRRFMDGPLGEEEHEVVVGAILRDVRMARAPATLRGRNQWVRLPQHAPHWPGEIAYRLRETMTAPDGRRVAYYEVAR